MLVIYLMLGLDSTWSRHHIRLSVPLESDPMKERVSFTKMGYYVEVEVIASHFFIEDLTCHFWKIIEPIVSWLISFSFLMGVFI
jgi:hypothetical protein